MNQVEKMRVQLSARQKEAVLKVLNGLLRNSRVGRIREVVNKFRLNWKVKNIQRQFLRRLLSTKAELVQIAFIKFRGLPNRIEKVCNKGAHMFKYMNVFERILQRTVRRVFEAFREQLKVEQNRKKRADVQLSALKLLIDIISGRRAATLKEKIVKFKLNWLSVIKEASKIQ